MGGQEVSSSLHEGLIELWNSVRWLKLWLLTILVVGSSGVIPFPSAIDVVVHMAREFITYENKQVG